MYDVMMNFLLHLMFRRKWRGGGIAYFKMLIQHLPRATDRNYKKPPSGWPVSELLFKDRISSMYYWGALHHDEMMMMMMMMMMMTTMKMTTMMDNLKFSQQ